MNTLILPINDGSLSAAKEIITSGGVVAFPTETVYGLGANAFEQEAVKSIFAIKGRPADNPLIVHVHEDYDISALVCDIPGYAEKLAEAFLPGALTMVYKSRGSVCGAVSCGLDTLAVRVPSHRGAQEFLKYLNLPIAAPSANISKHVSPVTAEHVYDDLKGRVPLILDSGKCSGGIESTVCDCTGEIPVILRSGLVTREMIASVAGECGVYSLREGEKARSPGMKYKHYSPRCKTKLYPYGEYEEAVREYERYNGEGVNTYLLCDKSIADRVSAGKVLVLGATDGEIASNLYAALREGEEKADYIIAVAPKKQDGIMAGVMNRLSKACAEK